MAGVGPTKTRWMVAALVVRHGLCPAIARGLQWRHNSHHHLHYPDPSSTMAARITGNSMT